MEKVMDDYTSALEFLELMTSDLAIIPIVAALFIACLLLDLVSKLKGGK